MNTQIDRIQNFRELSENIRKWAALKCITIQPFRDKGLSTFQGLPFEQQDAVLRHLKALEIALWKATGLDTSLLETVSVTSRALQEMGYTLAPEIIFQLEDSDSIIAYNKFQQMIFVSPNNFLLTSYSLEELYCRRWMDLFRRHDMISQVLIERATRLASSRPREPIMNTDIPPHSLIEVETDEKRAFICNSKFYAPIFLGNEPHGFIAVNRFRGADATLAEKLQSRNPYKDLATVASD